MKTCCTCLTLKPLSEFHNEKKSKDGKRYKCKECVYSYNRSRYFNNEEKFKLERKLRYSSEKEQAIKATCEWQKNNKEKVSKKNLLWMKDNRDSCNARSKVYKLTKKQRVPSWLTEDDLRFIKYFYTQAKTISEQTGIKHHVDHIIPLQGENVSGLHIPWNLQILTAVENIKKSNKL